MQAIRNLAPYGLIAFALLFALLIRIVPLTYSHFWDETVYLQHARVILDGRADYDELSYRPPFLSLIYALGFALWNNIFVANLVQGIITTVAVVFMFLFIRPAFGLATAVFGALLLAFTPYFVIASHDLLTDMPAVALMISAMWLFDKPGSRYAIISGIVYALAIQTRFTSLFLLTYFVVDSLFCPRNIRRLAAFLVGAAAAMIPYLSWGLWNFGSAFLPFIQARKIITQWTAPTPPSLYTGALLQIFPYSTWVCFGVGILLPIARWVRTSSPRHANRPPFTRNTQSKRRTVLLIWGGAFLIDMLSIPHKEVRYLLPLLIPVVIISALGATEIFRWCRRQGTALEVVTLLVGITIVVMDYGPSLQKLREPWVNSTESEEVHIGNYLRDVSTPNDTIYAAHNFPVFAFYSERRTVSLLPIQETFDDVWRDAMKEPGFLVYYVPAGINETHALNPVFKPDRRFIEANHEFQFLRGFSGAIVYRYQPASH